jgi:tetratricopeptide (TPR) repeat protein
MASPEPVSMLGKIAGYIEILDRDPHSTVFVPLAEAYRQMGLLDDALDAAQKGVTALPKFSPGYTILGRVRAQRNELNEAEAAFWSALEIDPESVPTLKGLARVCGMQGQRERARQLLLQAQQLEPGDTTVTKMLAALGPAPAGRSVAPRPASAPAHSAAEADGDDDALAPFATATIAEIYVKQGLLGKAAQVYRDLLKANPANANLEARYRELDRQLRGEVAPAADPEASGLPIDARADTTAGEEDRTLAILMRWLDAIRERRDDVC